MSEITFDSKEEMYFAWYLHELQEGGFILRWKYQPKPFHLADSVKYSFTVKLKTKTKVVEKSLLKPHQYQADFLIVWSDKAINVFFQNPNDFGDPLKKPFIARYVNNGLEAWQTIVDVKGTFNQNDAWRRFSIAQKWVYQKYQIYIQKVIPIKLFKASFTPKRYLLTDKKTKHRLFKYTPISLHQFLNGE